MASLTGIFKAVPEQPVEDNDKLVDLFRNRSELKKEFAALRDEKYQLQDRIKEHRGSIERVQQKLSHLEALLLDPEWVHNVVTFYQLRRLAAHCESRLARFAEQIKQSREQRVHDKALADWEASRDEERARIDADIGERRMRLQTLEDQLLAERHKLQSLGGISKVLKGKAQSATVDEIEQQILTLQGFESKRLLALEEIDNREPPPNPGLDVGAKRSINFMILAFAQQLYLNFFEDHLAALAKEASEKSVGAVNYGGKLDCDEILERLNARREEVDKLEQSTEVLQRRAQLIAEHAAFRRAEDVVPETGSIATVYDISKNGVVSKIDANLLGENYFGVAKVLSR